MPIKIPDNLPAAETLQEENIFVMPQQRALTQDIRALRIVVLNIMPTKIATETQILRLLSNSPLQVEVDLLQTASYDAKNVSQEHLVKFYQVFADIKEQKYDGMIITGAPVERMAFQEVDYWSELKDIMAWTRSNVFSTLHLCWGAQAGLKFHYGIDKYPLEDKITGVFKHRIHQQNTKLLRGFDDEFYAPHSRYTEVREEDIKECDELRLLAKSPEAGVYIVANKDNRQIFVTGHSEYDHDTLKNEYLRDLEKEENPPRPQNYFTGEDPGKKPLNTWRAHAHLLFGNWLNYCVYQETPYDISKISEDMEFSLYNGVNLL